MATKDYRYPYGTSLVTDEFRDEYNREYEYATQYTLPRILPTKHPDFSKIVGRYPMDALMPSWWISILEDVPWPIAYLLKTVTVPEFIDGKIEVERYKEFRSHWPKDVIQEFYPQSPKLSQFISKYAPNFVSSFNDRGSASQALDLIIACDYRSLLYMSNGKGWHSCQHWKNGSANSYLPAHFFEPGTGLVAVVERGKDIGEYISRDGYNSYEGSILSRVLLKRVYHAYTHEPTFMFERVYQNNISVAKSSVIYAAKFIAEKLGYTATTVHSNEVSRWIRNSEQILPHLSVTKTVPVKSDIFATPDNFNGAYMNYGSCNRLSLKSDHQLWVIEETAHDFASYTQEM